MGVQFDTREYEGADAVAFVISLNLHRRHLTESQRAAVAAKLANLANGQKQCVADCARAFAGLVILLICDYIKSMDNKLSGRGGPGRGQGRKRKPDAVKTVPVMVRMLPDQKDKLQRLGGAPWVRDRIDQAKEPQSKE